MTVVEELRRARRRSKYPRRGLVVVGRTEPRPDERRPGADRTVHRRGPRRSAAARGPSPSRCRSSRRSGTTSTGSRLRWREQDLEVAHPAARAGIDISWIVVTPCETARLGGLELQLLDVASRTGAWRTSAGRHRPRLAVTRPVGAPASSVSAPGRSASAPDASSAAELARSTCPSTRTSASGRSADAASRSARSAGHGRSHVDSSQPCRSTGPCRAAGDRREPPRAAPSADRARRELGRLHRARRCRSGARGCRRSPAGWSSRGGRRAGRPAGTSPVPTRSHVAAVDEDPLPHSSGTTACGRGSLGRASASERELSPLAGRPRPAGATERRRPQDRSAGVRTIRVFASFEPEPDRRERAVREHVQTRPAPGTAPSGQRPRRPPIAGARTPAVPRRSSTAAEDRVREHRRRVRARRGGPDAEPRETPARNLLDLVTPAAASPSPERDGRPRRPTIDA